MRISLLEERENFNEIVSETLQLFWSKKYASNIHIAIGEDRAVEKESLLYQHKYFNFIAPANAPKEAFIALKLEYSKSGSTFRSLLLKLYFSLSTSKIGLPLFSDKRYTVRPRVPEQEPFLIYGGNTRIRIVYPIQNEMKVILKSGFDKSNITKEINYRSNKNPKVAPSWRGLDSEGSWFIEEYKPGTPINRISNKGKRLELRKEALEATLNQVVLPYANFESDYINKLISKIETSCSSLETKELRLPIEGLLKEIKIELEKYDIRQTMVSQSHGDFQDANILLTADGIKIIDWETTDLRSVTYDFFTLLFKARKSFKEDHNIEIDEDLFGLAVNWYKSYFKLNLTLHHNPYILIWLLEEIDYSISSTCASIYRYQGIGLTKKIEDLRLILNQIYRG